MAKKAHKAAHKSTVRSASGGKTKVVARSALTGRFVLRPASKPGVISIQKANNAVQAVSSKT